VTGTAQVLRFSVRVDGYLDAARPAFDRDAGTDAVDCIDADGEGRLVVVGVFADHEGQFQAIGLSPLKARQIKPRAFTAIKLMLSGVANWAAQITSPSFSRFSSSTTTRGRPALRSARALSIESN
jgi:hypothetical protein